MADARAQFEFPNRKHWDEFVAKLESVLRGNDPVALAEFEPEARRALAGLKEFPGSDDYVAWLQERIDYISMAKYLDGEMPALPPPPQSANQCIPQYDQWLERLRGRPQPDARGPVCCRPAPVLRARACRRNWCGWRKWSRVSIRLR